MSKKSPMQLSLDYMNKRGYVCEIVERWNHFGKVRHDCFGFGDILAYRTVGEIVLLQTTSMANFAARRNKILKNPYFPGWKISGGKVFLHGWGDKGLREEEL